MTGLWQLPKKITASEKAEFLHFTTKNSQQLGWSERFSELLWRKGWRDQKDAQNLIEVSSDQIYSSFTQLAGALPAAKIIQAAIKEKTPISIFGDYDVDGISSTALLWRFLYYELKLDVKPYLPHRAREGYGLNRSLLEKALKEHRGKKQILITLDCGIRDYKLLAKLKADYPELVIIITDHHQLPENPQELPKVACIVHPLLPESKIEPAEICAAAVAWNLIQATRKMLSLPETSSGIELVALATVCDLMPLIGINRIYVKAGLAEFGHTQNEGLLALIEIAGLNKEKISSYDLGFVLGPRINATGRIGDPILGLKLLCTEKTSQARILAAEINELNLRRQNITQNCLTEIELEFQQAGNPTQLIFLERPELPEGIIGLVAGKLQDRYRLPVIVTSKNQHGNWVGSARSIPELNITDLLTTNSEFLEKFGGHSQAAGFTVTDEKLSVFKQALMSQTKALTELNNSTDRSLLKLDLVLKFAEANLQLATELNLLEPFGNSNERPLILIQEVKLAAMKKFGKQSQHLRYLPDQNLHELQIIRFNALPEELATTVKNENYEFVGHLGYNEFNYRVYPQLIIKNR